MAEPAAGRPYMPGYQLPPAGDGTLAWDWAAERLTDSRRYWVGTVTPAGAPHVMPMWALWFEDALWFSTGAASRKARNLAANPACRSPSNVRRRPS